MDAVLKDVHCKWDYGKPPDYSKVNELYFKGETIDQSMEMNIMINLLKLTVIREDQSALQRIIGGNCVQFSEELGQRGHLQSEP